MEKQKICAKLAVKSNPGCGRPKGFVLAEVGQRLSNYAIISVARLW
jgi:hypothetical protein